MDQVISFSLSDIFIAVFEIYREQITDIRADSIIELFRYNTNNRIHILLLRYGFPPEMISDIAQYIEAIDDDRIVFRNTIANAPSIIQRIVDWYLPVK
jgi:helicase